jgi:hypothetical protein
MITNIERYLVFKAAADNFACYPLSRLERIQQGSTAATQLLLEFNANGYGGGVISGTDIDQSLDQVVLTITSGKHLDVTKAILDAVDDATVNPVSYNPYVVIADATSSSFITKDITGVSITKQ